MEWLRAIPPEGWALLGTALTAVGTSAAAVTKFFGDRIVAKQAAATQETADAARRIAELQDKIIANAERRESETNQRADEREATANKRMEAALAGMGSQSQIITNLSATVTALAEQQKSLMEEMRRGNNNAEALSRQIERLLAR